MDGRHARTRRNDDDLTARAVISAVGQLNRPHLPTIEGQRGLRRAGVPLRASGTTRSTSRGKRVAMIGAGASGFQIAPAIADEVEQPHRVPAHRTVDVPEPELPRRGGSGRAVGAPAPAVLRPLVPVPAVLAAAATRASTRPASTRITRTSRRPSARSTRSPGSCSPSGSPARSATIRNCSPRWCPTIRRPASALCRTTAAGCETLTRDNVELVRAGIDHIESDAVVTEDGTRYPADVIVYATGFQANKMLWPMTIRRPRRRNPQRALGRTAVGISGHHRARLSELLLYVRARHQPGPAVAA